MRKINKLFIYGDSLSTGTHGEGGYEPALAAALRPGRIGNFSVGSSGLSRRTPRGMLEVLDGQEERGLLEEEGADVVLIWHGSNDWYWGTPLGEAADATEETFYGCIHQAVGRVRKRNPEALLLWATPLFRWERPFQGTEPGPAYELPNRAGATMLAYNEAVCRSAEREGFLLVPMRQLAGIHAENESRYLEDHVHPNRAGYERIEKIWIGWIRQALAQAEGETCRL